MQTRETSDASRGLVSSVNLQGVTEGYAVLDRVCGGMKEGSPLPYQEPGASRGLLEYNDETTDGSTSPGFA
jgi:hypothetical protein